MDGQSVSPASRGGSPVRAATQPGCDTSTPAYTGVVRHFPQHPEARSGQPCPVWVGFNRVFGRSFCGGSAPCPLAAGVGLPCVRRCRPTVRRGLPGCPGRSSAARPHTARPRRPGQARQAGLPGTAPGPSPASCWPVHRPLPAARCPLPAARCPLPAARCPLSAPGCRHPAPAAVPGHRSPHHAAPRHAAPSRCSHPTPPPSRHTAPPGPADCLPSAAPFTALHCSPPPAPPPRAGCRHLAPPPGPAGRCPPAVCRSAARCRGARPSVFALGPRPAPQLGGCLVVSSTAGPGATAVHHHPLPPACPARYHAPPVTRR